jgi:hypothetical protein
MDIEHIKACFTAQMVYGALALAAIMFAAISWGEKDALIVALGSCLGVILTQQASMAQQNRLAIFMWWGSIALAILALFLLL